MAKLHKFVSTTSVSQRLLKGAVGQKTYDELHPIGTSLVKAATPPPAEPVVPLPDEEALTRARRRALLANSNRTGRASTILTDRLGP